MHLFTCTTLCTCSPAPLCALVHLHHSLHLFTTSRVCLADEYADSEVLGFNSDDMCKTCPTGRYSEAGAVGVEECLDKPVCTEEDVVPIDTQVCDVG
jgi:hypothetical protein